MSVDTFEALRRRHVSDRDAALPGYVAALELSDEGLRAEREQRLRRLLETAKLRSPWHAARLRDVDPARMTECDLTALPIMTKTDLMDNFDSIVTDPRLTRSVVDDYVESPPENLYLFDRYVAVASGGSSGRRGIFVYDWDAFIAFNCQIVRWRLRGAPPPAAPLVSLWATRGAHVSYLGLKIFPPPVLPIHVAPTTPLPEMVARLDTLQPKTLSGYASTLALLAAEARAGRLRITPEVILTCGEPLLPEMRAEIEATWNVHVENYLGMSEGPYALPCSAGDAMHLPDDLHCIEPVDEDGRPVAPGAAAAKFLLTNLFNFTQPLIRYEVTDQFVVVPGPCPCGCAARRVDQVLGRMDDTFVYAGGVRVHPLAIRAPLGRNRHVTEYQVRQTPRGVQVTYCAEGPVEESSLADAIARGLMDSGVVSAQVELERVAELPRQVSGKLKRFVALPVRR